VFKEQSMLNNRKMWRYLSRNAPMYHNISSDIW